MQYNILYTDPPWKYENENTGGSLKSGASAKYKTLLIEDLIKLPVTNVAETASVLFMWATVPLLPEAFEVMNAWGFSYKTKVSWEKRGKLGLGFWFRGQMEELLLGVRGKVTPFRCQERNIRATVPGDHSDKPEYFRQLIELATAQTIKSQRRLEIFARRRIPGWDAIGYDIDHRDIRVSLPMLIESKGFPTTINIKKEDDLFTKILGKDVT